MNIQEHPVIETVAIIYMADILNGLYWLCFSGSTFSGVTFFVYFFLPLTVLAGGVVASP